METHEKSYRKTDICSVTQNQTSLNQVDNFINGKTVTSNTTMVDKIWMKINGTNKCFVHPSLSGYKVKFIFLLISHHLQ